MLFTFAVPSNMNINCICDSEWGYVYTLVEIINATRPLEEVLKPAEVDTFTAMVLAHRDVGTLSSTTARDMIKDLVRENAEFKNGRKKKELTDNALIKHRKALVKANWLRQDGNYFELAPMFRFPKGTFGIGAKLCINLHYGMED